MDLENFTERSRGFVQAAQGAAQRSSHQQLTPEHLLKVLLEDKEGLAANLMRALELRTERQHDRGLNWAINWAYDRFAGYGRSPGRPLLIAIGLYFVVAAFLYQFDGGVLGVDERFYTGWRELVRESGREGRAYRSALLALQTVINPFGLFGVRKLVITGTGFGQALIVVQGLLTYSLFIMSAFGIRKRFKLH